MALRRLLGLQKFSKCLKHPQNIFIRNCTAPATNQADQLQASKVNKGIQKNIDSIETRAKFMEGQRFEFEIGRRQLANMMGEDPEFFTQEDINRSLEYILPSGLYSKRSRPTMKHPDEIYIKAKEAQFDTNGRPFHPFFFTLYPVYYQILHTISCKVRTLDHMRDVTLAIQNKSYPLHEINLDTSDSRWVTSEELNAIHAEYYKEEKYDFFILSLESLLNHPLAHKEKDFINKYRKRREHWLRKPDNEISYTKEDGLPYVTKSQKYKQAVADVTVYGRGTGKIEINNKSILYFREIQCREEVIFPLLLTNLIGTVDIVAKIKGTGFCSEAHAMRQALSLALVPFVDESMKTRMKIAGLLERDPRINERKKPGQRGARAKKVWRKR